jgi:hypothetical protein
MQPATGTLIPVSSKNVTGLGCCIDVLPSQVSGRDFNSGIWL